MGVWTEDHLEQTSRRFLTPLQKRCEDILERLIGKSFESHHQHDSRAIYVKEQVPQHHMTSLHGQHHMEVRRIA